MFYHELQGIEARESCGRRCTDLSLSGTARFIEGLTPSKTAGISWRPSMPGTIKTLTSSTRPVHTSGVGQGQREGESYRSGQLEQISIHSNLGFSLRRDPNDPNGSHPLIKIRIKIKRTFT